MNKADISRREFLKLANSGSLAFTITRPAPRPSIGRVCCHQAGTHHLEWHPALRARAFNANQILFFGSETVIEISGIEENGEAGNPFNSTWYQVDNGNKYSG